MSFPIKSLLPWPFPSQGWHHYSYSCSGQSPGTHLGLLFDAHLENNPVTGTVSSTFGLYPESSNFSLLTLSPSLCHLSPSPNNLTISYQVRLLPLSPLLDLFKAQFRACHSPIHYFQRLPIRNQRKVTFPWLQSSAFWPSSSSPTSLFFSGHSNLLTHQYFCSHEPHVPIDHLKCG